MEIEVAGGNYAPTLDLYWLSWFNSEEAAKHGEAKRN